MTVEKFNMEQFATAYRTVAQERGAAVRPSEVVEMYGFNVTDPQQFLVDTHGDQGVFASGQTEIVFRSK
jgi:hypothetical protein